MLGGPLSEIQQLSSKDVTHTAEVMIARHSI